MAIRQLVVASPKEAYAKDLYAKAKKLGMEGMTMPGFGIVYHIYLGQDLGEGKKEYNVSVRQIASGDKLGGQVTTQFYQFDRFVGRVTSGGPAQQDNLWASVDEVIAEVAARINRIRKHLK